MSFNFNHIHLMKHALGNPDPRSKPSRNYYAAAPQSEEAWLWEELVELGYAVESVAESPSSLRYFHVTKAGRLVICPS